MKLLASLPRRSARLILPAAALLTAMGATAAAAASPLSGGLPASRVHNAPAKPVTFKWHPFKLENGWKSASTKQLVTGTPAWALKNGVVYLRGAIRQPDVNASSIFASLPKYARPVSNDYLQVFSKSGVPGILYISSDGDVKALNGNTYAFTSLSGVSFPTAAIKSHQFKTLLNGWQSSQPTYDTGNPAYAISKGVVYLSGSMHYTGTPPPPSPYVFRLPKAARPAHALLITVYTVEGETPGTIEIEPQGEVDVSGAGAAGYTSLAGISFPVAGTKWHKFKLQSGWTGSTKFDTAVPVYTVVNGVVYLDGAMTQSPAGSDRWTTLPAAVRTADALSFDVMTTSGTLGAVTLNGTKALISSTPAGDAQMMTFLSGLAYPAGS